MTSTQSAVTVQAVVRPRLFPETQSDSTPFRDLRTYEVRPYDNKGKLAGWSVYIRAATREGAERGGKLLLRAFGQRGRFQVRAWDYNPLNDSEMSGYVQAV